MQAVLQAVIQLFLNVLNGSMALHAGDSVILRYCMATIINATQQFRNIFNTRCVLQHRRVQVTVF